MPLASGTGGDRDARKDPDMLAVLVVGVVPDVVTVSGVAASGVMPKESPKRLPSKERACAYPMFPAGVTDGGALLVMFVIPVSIVRCFLSTTAGFSTEGEMVRSSKVPLVRLRCWP